MIRRLLLLRCIVGVCCFVLLGACQTTEARGLLASPLAQSDDDAAAADDEVSEKQSNDLEDEAKQSISHRRPGGYLSLLKLGLIAFVFFLWVRWADWVNRDALQIGDKIKMQPEVWSPIMVGSFLVGLAVVLFVPIFWAGYPVFVLAAMVPPITYQLVRRGRIKNDKSAAAAVRNKGNNSPDVVIDDELPQDDGAMITFTTGGADSNEKQARLIRARQNIGFPTVKNLLFDAQFKRAEQVLMDCGRDGAKVKILVDGLWHPFPPMDREMADGVVESIKSLAGLNTADRRSNQTGAFDLKSEHGKANLQIRTQGVATGERVQIKFIAQKSVMKLDELGMFPEMTQTLCDSMNNSGVTIISAPAGQGLTSTWQGAIMSSDRLTRDIVGFYKPDETDSDIENIMPKPYDPANGETSVESLTKILLAQPDAVIVPEVDDSDTMDLLVLQANTQQRAITLRTPANGAAEAFLKMYAKSKDRGEFLKATRSITCQRLLRRLCPTCRVEVRVKPAMIQKLGGNPKTQGSLYNQYQLPPPEQRVDEKGNPIEIPPCTTCGGIGYIGRIAVFELLEFNDTLRDVARKQPQAAGIEAAANKQGKLSLTQQAYKLVLLGVTSLAEVQRTFRPSKPRQKNS